MKPLDILYPPICLHCKEGMEKQLPLCDSCLNNFTLLSVEGRCDRCFVEISQRKGRCLLCRQESSPFQQLASCFEEMGPAKSLLDALLFREQTYLAKDFAAYLALQIDRLQWPTFDLIVGVPPLLPPSPFQVGKELSQFLGCPFIETLKRKWTPVPQFSLKKNCNIIHRCVLLLATGMGRGKEISSAGWTLDEGAPEMIYGITLCMSSNTS
ncbi:MAG: hypothetical protein KR126chlam1_00231 [Chlamydiae bacterium]|nr:hypothetical protein [Chlamydiota bacterium]